MDIYNVFRAALESAMPMSEQHWAYFKTSLKVRHYEKGDFTNQTLFQAELMVGFKGQFFKRFDLLNASTLGLMYRFTPMLNEGSTRIFPLHFTWRFLF